MSSDESSDSSEETTAKALKISNIRMVSKVEEAYHKYVSIYLNTKGSTPNPNIFPREQRRKEKARKRLSPGSGYGTLTGKPSTHNNQLKIINHSLQPAPIRELSRAAPVPVASFVMESIQPGMNYKGTVRTVYDKSNPHNQNTNVYSSPGCPPWYPWKLEDKWKQTNARSNPKAGRNQEAKGAGGPEAGVGKDADHAPDHNISAPYFMNNFLRVHVNPVPPGSQNFKAPRSPGSGNTLPIWANSTTTFLKPMSEIQNRQYTIVNLPRLSKANAQPSNKGPQHKNKKPGNTINSKKNSITNSNKKPN